MLIKIIASHKFVIAKGVGFSSKIYTNLIFERCAHYKRNKGTSIRIIVREDG